MRKQSSNLTFKAIGLGALCVLSSFIFFFYGAKESLAWGDLYSNDVGGPDTPGYYSVDFTPAYSDTVSFVQIYLSSNGDLNAGQYFGFEDSPGIPCLAFISPHDLGVTQTGLNGGVLVTIDLTNQPPGNSCAVTAGLNYTFQSLFNPPIAYGQVSGNAQPWIRIFTAGGYNYFLTNQNKTSLVSISSPTENQQLASSTPVPFYYNVFVSPTDTILTECQVNFTNRINFELTSSATSSIYLYNNFIYSSTTLPVGSYTGVVFCRTANGGATDFESQGRDFTVSTTSIESIYGVNPNNLNALLGLATTTCSVSNIAGCFQNALVFLLWPNQDIIQKLSGIGGLIVNKPPFGYFTIIKNALQGFNASSTPAFYLTIPVFIKNTYISPLDISLAAILWFFFLVHFYKRLKHLQIF